MIAQVVVTGPARRDLARILSDLEQVAGYRVAERYATNFEATFRRLARFPSSGAPRPGLGRNIRIAVVSPYLVIYQDEGDTATVVRVLHGKRNITRDLIR